MNDRGDFYIGNKGISSNTGKEEVFDTPVPTITGEDVFVVGSETGVDVINPLDVLYQDPLRLRVELRTIFCQSSMDQLYSLRKLLLPLMMVLSPTLCSSRVTLSYLENTL